MADFGKAQALSAQMYSMRDTARSLWGAEYAEKIAPWQSMIKKTADQSHEKPLLATIHLAKGAAGNNFAVIALMAAYVEMVEPSPAVPPHRAMA